jgi:hypothetical protein
MLWYDHDASVDQHADYFVYVGGQSQNLDAHLRLAIFIKPAGLTSHPINFYHI